MLPARAGMVRPGEDRGREGPRAPRSRGDGPLTTSSSSTCGRCSPLARGWSAPHAARRRERSVLPARAGMVLGTRCRAAARRRAPRSRGDGPVLEDDRPVRARCSPLARGWSRGARSRAPCWSVLPARAGMVPGHRRRGGGGCRAPRSRGDGPAILRELGISGMCSPLARGWSLLTPVAAVISEVLPARAGMVRPRWASLPTPTYAPRSRGDGPEATLEIALGHECSPLARGWSGVGGAPRGRDRVLPARAGMVPFRRVPVSSSTSAPRSRGDGPPGWYNPHEEHACSPLARGWSGVRR